MDKIPRRQSLVSQTVQILVTQIEAGAWREWLPGERELCESMQVSRNTLRAALAQLKRDRLIRSEHGSGNRILVCASKPKPKLASRDVGLLSPETLDRLRPSQTLWIDDLRAMLSERGCRLHLFQGPQYFRANPAAALERLVSQHPHACWIITLSEMATQEWFEKRGLPCVVAGSTHEGINLPFRDLDHRAICRHAAGTLLGQGHQRIALLIQKSNRAGDLESELGFKEGVEQSSRVNTEALITYHEGTVPSIGNAMRHLMRAPAPTGLLVANAYHYLTVVGRLGQLGKRVPGDVSVISRDDDTFLSFVLPAPARYVVTAHTMAKSLMRPVLELIEGGVVTHRSIRIMPDFIRGESLTERASDAG